MDIKVLASGSSGNAYRVSDGKTALLLDAGIPLRALQVGLQFRVTELAGCLITHSHQDHCKAATDLLRLGVDIYTSQGTIDACRLTGEPLHTLRTREHIQIGTWVVLPFDVEHDAPESLGFLLESTVTREKLLYFTDTFYVRYRFSGLTHIMAEVNYSQEALQRAVTTGITPVEQVPRLVKSHMSLENFLDFLRANDLRSVRQIYLLHLSSRNSDGPVFKEAVQRLTGTEVYIAGRIEADEDNRIQRQYSIRDWRQG